MALHYQTEYSLGRRGRVCRSYRGIPALIAIVVDLVLGLVFGVVALALRVVRFVVVTTLRAVAWLLSLPWRLSRAISAHLARRPTPLKPAGVGFDEL